MNRIIVSMPPDLERKLRARAAERGVSISEFVREAVADKVEADEDLPRKLESAGSVASGHRTTGRDSAEMKFEPRSWRS